MATNLVIGKHLIADFCGALYQTDITNIEYALREASVRAGATVLEVTLHNFANNNGITGVALLAESHISIHTWPEHDYIALDIFMCGSASPEIALDWLHVFFKPTKVRKQLLERSTVPAAG